MEGGSMMGTRRKSLPPGFRFYPTDEELFMYYLKRKVLGKSLKPEMIAEVDVYRFEPWDLPPMACLKTRDLNWFFFCPRAKKYPNGGRANRATEYGYWKSTGNDRTMVYDSRPVGKIKTLIFHRGKAPKGVRTDWVMHEYRLEDMVLAEKGVSQDAYVICKIYEKSGLGPRNGENYGARFVEEEWDSDDAENMQERDLGVVVQEMGCGNVASPNGSVSALTNVVNTPIVASPDDTPNVYPATTAAIAGTPYTTAASVGTPYTAAASVGTPYTAAASVGTPYTASASVGAPCTTTACVGLPNVTAASVGLPNVTAASVCTPSVDSASALGASMGSLGAAVASESSEEELNRLLSYLTEEADNEGDVDIFNGLGDLSNPSGSIDRDWRDLFIELDDLI